MKQVPLPGGGTATVREASDLTRGERKGLRNKAKIAMSLAAELTVIGIDANDPKTWGLYAKISPEGVAPFEQYEGELLLVALVSWTRQDAEGKIEPIPTTQEEWDNLRPVTIYDILVKECHLLTTPEEFSADGAADPKAPTDDSTSSLSIDAVEPSSQESSLIPT
jgi:hypothetical protein